MKRRLSLRQQISLLVGLLCLGIVTVAATGAAFIAHRQTKQNVMTGAAEAAGTLAAVLDRGMAERFREIRNLANMQPLEGMWSGDRASVRLVLDQLQSTFPDYSWIGFATKDGIVQASTGRLLEGESVAARPWFQDGLKGPTVGDVHEAKLLERLLKPGNSGEPLRFVDVAAPVKNSAGDIIGVVGAHLNWAWARERLQILISDESNQWSGAISILAQDGTVLLGPGMNTKPFSDNRLAAMIKEGRGSFEDESNVENYLTGFAVTRGYRDYPGLRWIVVSRQPETVAFAAARSMVWTIAGIGLAAALAGILFAMFIAQSVSRPIGLIIEAADRIGRDPTISLPPHATGSREIVRLSAALRSLVRRAGAAEQRALDNATKHEEDVSKLTQLAETDALSGLLNRRGFNLLAEDAFEQFRRSGRTFAVLILDIDFFKRVNDTYGHPTGDDVIRGVGETLSRTLRPVDKVCRFGGEEFVVLVREAGREGIMTVAQNLRRAVESQTMESRGMTLSVTVSVGGAIVADTDRDIQDVIERADSALYEAKASGRNRAVIAGLQPQLATAVA
ncbi:sensor domain-containing diguanylate cyclase [Microvirga antarctica]|uniref:sensor domain-containing diguanylate cyclase n=1 Tax=Microvirga antarctica TaxID=2819233 RepID=UPI001B314EB6|nr:sensor domain-containing diguanylate cyclase [Microvirga antarctica]